MNVLITLADIQKYCKDVSSHIDTNALNPYVLEAQIVELKKLLGLKFFHFFLSKINDPRMQELLNGKTYVIGDIEMEYQGLKPVIAYYAYARMIQKHGLSITKFGVVKKESEYSSHVDDKTVASMAGDAKSTARVYEEDFKLFIEENKADYPEYFALCEGNAPRKNGSIKISAVG